MLQLTELPGQGSRAVLRREWSAASNATEDRGREGPIGYGRVEHTSIPGQANFNVVERCQFSWPGVEKAGTESVAGAFQKGVREARGRRDRG